LRCRAHNQYEADRSFGASFMRRKRDEAAARKTHARERAGEVVPFLRALQVSPDVARRAAERCETIPDAPIEERVRLALSFLGTRIARPRPALSSARSGVA